MIAPFLLYRKLLLVGDPRPSQSPSVTAIALSVTFGDSSPKGRAKDGEGYTGKPPMCTALLRIIFASYPSPLPYQVLPASSL